jgi:TRAP-type uncharacterized transport system substrate-binding protein
MACPSIVRAILAAFCLLAAAPGHAAKPVQAPSLAPPAGIDVIGVETGGTAGITIRMAEDLAGLIDDGTTRRLVPLVGHGGIQDIADLLEGRAVDMAFLQLDVLDYARAQRLFPDLETRISYVTRLNYVDFHLLAPSDISSVADLTGKIVNVGPTFGDTSITAARLFRLLKVSVVPGGDEPGLAIDRLRRGEIAAVAYVGGNPSPLFRLSNTAGLHVVPIPLTQEVVSVYVPARLTAEDYPGLIAPGAPVDTIAVGTGLFAGPAAPGSNEYRKLASAADTLLTQFQTLMTPGHHAKWSEVNLSSQIPGWRRFPAADEWLKRSENATTARDPRMTFTRFLEEREKATGSHQQLSQQQRNALFDQFQRWQSGKGN